MILYNRKTKFNQIIIKGFEENNNRNFASIGINNRINIDNVEWNSLDINYVSPFKELNATK